MYNSFDGDKSLIDKPDLTEEFLTPKESLNSSGLTNSQVSSSSYQPIKLIKGGKANQNLRYTSPIPEVRESLSESITIENNEISSPKKDKQSEELKSTNGVSEKQSLIKSDSSSIKSNASSTLAKSRKSNKSNPNKDADDGIQLKENSDFSNSNEIKNFESHSIRMNQSEIILTKIMELNDSSFDGYEKIYEEQKQPHELKMYINSYITPEKNRVNKTRSEWYVPCTPEEFIKFMNNVPEQNKLDNGATMTSFKVIKHFNETRDRDYVILYLSYKKMLIVSPRDFIYFKHIRKINDRLWCDASTSIEHQEFPVFKDKLRGEIILSGHVVSEVIDPKTNQPRTKVKLYSEIDFKTNVPLMIAKSYSINEMKKYIEKCIVILMQEYPIDIQENNQEIL